MSRPKLSPMYLDKIVAHKRASADFQRARAQPWEEQLASAAHLPKRSLVEALLGAPPGQPSIIAEMKRASPSKGSFAFEGQLADQVRAYERGGARAVSVLTDGEFFDGRLEDLREARQAVSLPILRKDFLLEPWEVMEAKIAGADAVLLIAAVLDQDELSAMINLARRVELEVLLEIHDRHELERILELPVSPHAVGINNRNLQSFELSLDTTASLAPLLPKEICRVSESGFATRDDLLRFEGIVDAFLIGETLMRSRRPDELLLGWIKG